MSALPEPTTAGAFDEILSPLEWMAKTPTLTNAGGEAKRALIAIALLERRMGAMMRAIQMVLAVAGEGPMLTEDERKTLRATLTDAPPVFTLEEVRKAMVEDGHSENDARRVTEWLTGHGR